jgi:hypothetical protein
VRRVMHAAHTKRKGGLAGRRRREGTLVASVPRPETPVAVQPGSSVRPCQSQPPTHLPGRPRIRVGAAAGH